MRNLRDLYSQLSKSVFCRFKRLTYRGPQLWQEIPDERRSSRNKMKNSHTEFAKRTLENWDSYKNNTQNNSTHFFYCFCLQL